MSRKELGHRIKVLRVDRGLTQAELEQRSGVTNSTISRIEHAEGHKWPTIDKLLAIADVLQVDVSALLESDSGSPTRVWSDQAA